ncbi:SMU1112c/YaeR family gloxylase I-like metalloprotein [Flavobacterium selenitireducens]|uniref:SMU1112c/YaeR family gloxylase I-like metalloprotein n=1 Tax=Flavobacterium selenitireducens TaxID=2722704 RepID=UPI00168B8FCC|nr:VOC family protein [Flavobacterium selenitireducens]MBD3583974.1 VOC family protein [Flavobacterium selenitireducens]
MKLNKIHHIAIICSDYAKSKAFYVDVPGLQIVAETYRSERDSHKLDLALNGTYLIELFSFPNPPQRKSYPEAAGLRHLAFETDDPDETIQLLLESRLNVEPIRVDEFTGKRFTFTFDPDGLPSNSKKNDMSK